MKILTKINNENQTIFGVGAPSRAATLINFCSLRSNLINNILEIPGSYKIDKYMPGTDIKVLDENYGLSKNPDYLLLFSWHIAEELVKSLRKKGFKGKFIVPLPKVRIVK